MQLIWIYLTIPIKTPKLQISARRCIKRLDSSTCSSRQEDRLSSRPEGGSYRPSVESGAAVAL